MDVAEVLHRASEAVERAGVAADLRALAFTTAVDLVITGAQPAVPAAARHAPLAPAPAPRSPSLTEAGAPHSSAGTPGQDRTASPAPQPGGGRGSQPPERGAEPEVGGAARRLPGPTAQDDPWEAIAAQVGVRPERLDRLWEERAGRLQLTGDVARLGRTRAARVGTAAVLLLAALRWSGRDGGEPVPDAVVRAEVERLGLLDTGNYTKHLAARRSLMSVTGSGRGATYRLRFDGQEEARRTARALLED